MTEPEEATEQHDGCANHLGGDVPLEAQELRRGLTRRTAIKILAAGSGTAVLGTLGYSFLTNARREGASDLAELDLTDVSCKVRNRLLSPVELTQACLGRIERLNPILNAFITVSAGRALAEARAAEQEIAAGQWRGPLHGIPIALKDNIDTTGVRTTAATAVFENRVPTEDAEVVRRLKAAGAVFLGKLNMHEFALGTTSAISRFGAVHNPWDLERIAGGSSGGSGAAVAASLCFGAVGTDTGGSNRIPAACCGVVGLKPTYGVVSTRGVIPVSNSFDHVGPMCRTVSDTALMFGAMTDHRIAQECRTDSLPAVSDLRVGVIKAPRSLCDDTPIDSEIKAAVDTAVAAIRPLVAEVREVELPNPEQLGRLIDYEAYAFHAQHLAQTPERYDPRTRATILEGKEISEAEGKELRRDLKKHRAKIREAFSRIDLVMLPTLPSLPLLISEASKPFAQPACTFAFSLGGLPAMSVPCGYSLSGLPIGVLIGGPPLSEPDIFALALAYEKTREWPPRRPKL
jgi:aspartyl-tRNA(Asn)/glutamyl-tRNA(Gln) amidotransferase subunit A